VSQDAAVRVVAMVRAASGGDARARRALTALWRLATVVDLERPPAGLVGPPPGRPGQAGAAPGSKR
jgi:hypothetical protein